MRARARSLLPQAAWRSRPPAAAPEAETAVARWRQPGQIIPIFALFIFVLMGLTALVVDASWYWANTLRVQRAADAAALAGAVWLPGNPTSGRSAASAEATKNGYTTGGGVTVKPCQSSEVSTGCAGGGDARQMTVTISAPVPTYFMRVFGITSITARATSKAEYVQPLKMGSPLSDYGVYLDCKVTGSSITCSALPNPSGSGTLASEGFFGAIEGQGANRATGDAFATAYNSDPALNSVANSGGLIVQQYDPAGYEYEVSVPNGGATLYIWDPTFCATTTGPSGGHLGTGDHWLGTTNHNTAVPVSTYFRLWWDKNSTPYTTSDDVLVKDSGSLFKNEFQVDKSAAYASASPAGGANNDFSDGTEPALSGAGAAADCSSGAIANSALGGYWHNKWWPMASGLQAGTYRLQAMSTDPSNAALNANQAFENMWALDVVGSGGPAIYGRGRMVSYANIQSGAQNFYLAQIDQRAGAGKTIEIDLFDP
ncbi:MAG: pilus assembly protein TadG-related protein, partial [Gemmatimonadales bacterium]